MKQNLSKLISFFLITIVFIDSALAQQNMVRKWVAQKPIVKEADMVSATATVQDILQTSEYVDGFGRPLQSVIEKASPTQKDAVTMHLYDATGREVKKYMPFISNVAITGDVVDDGNFKTNAAQQQTAFNQSTYTGESFFYSQADFENSPLNRVTKSYAAGSSWVGASKGSSASSMVNTALDNVRIWNILDAPGSLPTSSANYTAGQLYKTRATDVKDLQVIEFRDKDGHVILKKVQLAGSADAGTGTGHAGWLCTYYVYDDYGNMRFIITPQVVELIDGGWSITSALADDLCYRYEYDDFGRKIISKSPGAGEEWFVYDKRGRIVMSQDANMRQVTQRQWKYYQYENSLDRLVSTGLLTDLTANYNNRVNHQTAATDAIQVSTAMSAYPVLSSYTTIEQLTRTYYDEYASWATGAGLSATADLSKATNTSYYYAASDVTFPYPQVVTSQSVMTRGLVTGSKTEVLKSNGTSYLYTISFYDDKGRIIQTQGTNNSGPGAVDKATTQYSWNGTPLRILEEHSKKGVNPQNHTILTKMEYDFAGRIQKIFKQISSTGAIVITNPEKRVAAFTYNELGQVKTKTLGTLPTLPTTNWLTGAAIETLNYDYNVRGWLTGINKDFTKPAGGSNYFGMELAYDKAISANGTTTFTTPLYNGNIAGMIWKSKGDAVARKYDYTYDNANQLTKALFTQNTSGSTWDRSTIDYSVNDIQYSSNGNIKKLNQNGFILGGASNIDNLTYNYGIPGNPNSNRLMNVQEAALNNSLSKLGDFHYTVTKTAASVDYGYDPNGNLTSDVNKGITSITYNVLNLPLVITAGPNRTITYTYDAAGNKLSKVTNETNVNFVYGAASYNTGIITTTTYIGGFVYQNKVYTDNALMTLLNTAPLSTSDALQYVAHEEGRARVVTPKFNAINFAFDYFIRDNLGNVRATITDEPQTDYYPVATLEASTNNTTVVLEQRFYNITPANIVATKVNGVPAPGMSWYSTAVGNSYLNNNGLSNPNPDALTINPTVTSNNLYKLPANGGTGGTEHTGLGITLKVTTGDLINIYGKSVWHSNGTSPSNTNYFGLPSTMLAFLNAFTGTGAVIDGSKGIATGSVLNNTAATTGPLGTWLTTGVTAPTGTPKAGFNYILFDEQFKPVSTGNSRGFIPVKSTPDDVQSFSVGSSAGGTINVPQSGYLYVYVSNESNQDVYFDNFQVVQGRSQLIEEKHYYPGGLAMTGIGSISYGKLSNAYGYQGKEMQAGEYYDGTGLEEYDFEARYYDPQLMRWHNQDPAGQFSSPYLAMGNNWPNGIDPDGRLFGIDDAILIGVAVGALMGGMQGGMSAEMNGGNFWNGAWKGALVGGIGAAIGSGLSSMGAFSSWGMVGGGMANGAIGGAVSGGLSSALNGGNILSGILKGSLWGGAMGGVMGALQRSSIGQYDSPLQESTKSTGEYYQSDQELNEYINEKIGDVDQIQSALYTKISLASETNLPKGMALNANQILERTTNGITQYAGAATQAESGGWFTRLKSQIFVSPGLKGIYYDGTNASQMIINHEFLHAFHLSNGFAGYNMYSERATSSYSFAYAKSYNMTSAYSIYLPKIGYFPAYYSWQSFNLLNLVRLGIK